MLNVQPRGYTLMVEEELDTRFTDLAMPDGTKLPGAYRYKIVALGDPWILAGGGEVPIKLNVGDYVLCDPNAFCPVGPPELHDGRQLYIIPVERVYATVQGTIDSPEYRRKRMQEVGFKPRPPQTKIYKPDRMLIHGDQYQ